MAQKIAVLTGPPRSDRENLVQQLLQRGYALVIDWTRDEHAAAALVGRVRQTHGNAMVLHIPAEADVG